MEQGHGTWGNRLKTFKTDNLLVTLLWLEPNRRCSWHVHKTAYNQFVVISGELGVKTEKGYITRLTEKQVFTVEPGVKHEFQTYNKPAIVEEIAYVKYDESDIKRDKLGGPLKEENEPARERSI